MTPTTATCADWRRARTARPAPGPRLLVADRHATKNGRHCARPRPCDRRRARLPGLLGRDVHLGGPPRERRSTTARPTRRRGRRTPVRTANPNYDADGYDYTVDFPAANGQVRLFDPIFCATGDNGHGGWFGAGDHWTGSPARATSPPGRGDLPPVRHPGHPRRHRRRRRAIATLTYDPGQPDARRLQRQLRDAAEHAASRRPPPTAPATRPQRLGVALRTGSPAGIYRVNVNTTSTRRTRPSGPRTCSRSGSTSWRQRARLRRRADGGLHQPGSRSAEASTSPRSRGPRRQDDGDRAVRPGRVERQRLPALPEPGRQQLPLRHLRLDVR